MDATEEDPPPPPDLHDLTRQLAARKADLLTAAAREADLRWTEANLRRELEAAERRAAEAAHERFEAMRTVLDACADSAGLFGWSRRRFLALVRRAARTVPDEGPRSARHAVLDAEARRLLSRRGARGAGARD